MTLVRRNWLRFERFSRGDIADGLKDWHIQTGALLCKTELARMLHQFLLRYRKLVGGLSCVSARNPQRVRNTPQITSLTCLATYQLVSPRDKTT